MSPDWVKCNDDVRTDFWGVLNKAKELQALSRKAQPRLQEACYEALF